MTQDRLYHISQLLNSKMQSHFSWLVGCYWVKQVFSKVIWYRREFPLFQAILHSRTCNFVAIETFDNANRKTVRMICTHNVFPENNYRSTWSICTFTPVVACHLCQVVVDMVVTQGQQILTITTCVQLFGARVNRSVFSVCVINCTI